MNSIRKYVNDGYILITDVPFETWNIVEMEWANMEMLMVYQGSPGFTQEIGILGFSWFIQEITSMKRVQILFGGVGEERFF